MPVLKEISNQFRLCVALMNDEHVMQHQPAVVADHFNAAMCKIEQLRRFLRKPDKQHDHWVDESILDAGMKKMVSAVLNKHMEPLRSNTFPEVFARDLGQWNDGEDPVGENDTEREIKESNCMGAIVLLYYYLCWHVLLILLNGKAYPCSKRSALWESELDFVSFFRDMPTEMDMFELRYMCKLKLAKWDKKCVETLPSSIMVDRDYMQYVKNEEGIKSRKTPLIAAYKSALFEARKADDPSYWWQKKTNAAGESFDFAQFSRAITSLVIEKRLALFGSVLSTFDAQDDVQKWRDMYLDIETQSGDTNQDEDDDDDDSKFKSNTKVYKHRLAKILKNTPYSDNLAAFKANAKEAAIYDYGSATLMMDVSRAYLKAMEFIGVLLQSESQAETLEVSFLQFVLNVHTKNMNVAALEALENADRVSNTFRKFVKTMINQRKSIINHDIPHNAVMVDGLAGYYWGSRPSVGEGVNHMYLAWPDITKTDLDVLRAMQTLCLQNASKISKEQITFSHIQPAVRNSLFVSTSVASLKKLLDVLKCHPALPNLDRNIQLSISPCAGDFNAYFYDKKAADPVWSNVTPSKEPMNQSKALKLLDREAAELEKRMTEASSFRKYPGVSWPVKIGANGTMGTNFVCFEYVRPIPKIVPSLSDSAYGVRMVMEELRDGARNAAARAAAAAAPAGPSAAPGLQGAPF